MLNAVDKQFHDLYHNLIDHGILKGDRTGHGTRMLPAQMLRLDCTDGRLPILSTREVPTKSFRREMLWFVSGQSSIKYLRDHKVGVWDSWFIPGSDVYDEPESFTLSLQERLNFMGTKEDWGIVDDRIRWHLSGRSSIGSTQLHMVMPNTGGVKSEYSNLSDIDIDFIKNVLDEHDVPRRMTPKFKTLSTKHRVSMAVEQGKGHLVYEFTRNELCGYVDGRIYEFRLLHPDGKPVIVGLGKDHIPHLNRFLTTLGIPTEVKNGGEPISLKRRLNRVSKNDVEKWEAINQALVPDPMIDWDGETWHVTVFKNGKFKDITIDYGQYINVTKMLDELKVPAYELLNADIGQGGYGPLWRHWQDTRMIDVDDTKSRDEYLANGYVLKGYMRSNEVLFDREDYKDALILHREIDQLQDCIDKLRTNPDDRRIIVTAQNPGTVWQAALQPCHNMFQFVSWEKSLEELWAMFDKCGASADYTALLASTPVTRDQCLSFTQSFCKERNLPTRNLTLVLVLRSSDTGLGLVFNSAQYAYLLHMVGHVVNMDPHEMITMGVDSHLYSNQIEPIKKLLERESHPENDPRVVFKRKVTDIDDFKFEDIDIVGYRAHDKIDIPVAV